MDNKIFKTKIGYELLLFIYGVMAFPIISSFQKQEYVPVLILSLLLLLMTLILISFRYKLQENQLVISSWFFYKKKIAIDTIYKIEKTNNIISSPAGSVFGRIEIYFDKNESIVISPENLNEFLAIISSINPSILIKK